MDKTKSLGVIIDENLAWDEQFKLINRKINAGLMALKRLKNVLPQSQLCCVYYCVIESYLRYGDIVCSSLNETKLAALQHI